MIGINHINGIVKAFNDIKMAGFKSCAIIRTPDYAGGYRDELEFSTNQDEDWWANLEPFHYVEWSGSVTALYTEWPQMVQHREPFHGEPVDVELSLFEEIEAYVKRLDELTI